MATITSAASGNFSDTATWVGGVVPTVGDIAVAATGHVVAIDVNTTVEKVTQSGTGRFTLGNGITLTAAVEASAGTFTSGGTVEVIATSGNTAYIVGNATGVSSTTGNVCAIAVTGAGTLDFTGSITGTAGNNFSEATGSAIIYTNVVCDIDVLGDVTGGTGTQKRGIQLGSSASGSLTIVGNISSSGTSNVSAVFVQGAATVTVTGNVAGGTGSVSNFDSIAINAPGSFASVTITGDVSAANTVRSHGVSITGSASSLVVTGDVSAGSGTTASGINTAVSGVEVVGDVTAANAAGIAMSGAGTVEVDGILTSSSTANAIVALTATDVLVSELKSDANNRWPIASLICRLIDSDTIVVVGTDDAGLVSYVNEDDVNGMPAELDVRDGTVYGALGGLEGTLVVPDPQFVFPGVATDDTVGTGNLIGAVADVTGAQIAAAITAIP